MNKTEFMDLLRYYFRKISEADLAEILSDYEAHFAEGKERGLSEEEICKELGSPKDIYEMYLHEGMLNEKGNREQLTDAKEKLADAAGKLANGAGDLAESAKKTWDTSISPRVPEAAGTISQFTLKLLTYVCFGAGFLIILCTALAVYLLSGTFPALGGLPPLPGLSTITLAALFGTGFFSGLSLFFVGLELRKYGGQSLPPAGNGSSSKDVPTEEDTAASDNKVNISMEEPAGAFGK